MTELQEFNRAKSEITGVQKRDEMVKISQVP